MILQGHKNEIEVKKMKMGKFFPNEKEAKEAKESIEKLGYWVGTYHQKGGWFLRVLKWDIT